MQFYADHPGRWLVQVLGDLATVGAVGLALWLARHLREAILALDAAALQLESSGERVSLGAGRAAEVLEGVPGVGGALARPFETLIEAGDELTAAGQQTSETVHTLALLLPLLLAALVIGYVAFKLLPDRVRWVLEVAEVRRVLDADDAARLLGLRAASTRSLRRLRRRVGDPAAALADGRWVDLARVELEALGLRTSRLDG